MYVVDMVQNNDDTDYGCFHNHPKRFKSDAFTYNKNQVESFSKTEIRHKR